MNYTTCTTDNDTQSWCSPTSIYAGQRLYCSSSTNSFQNNSCPLNLTMCNQIQLTSFDTTQFYASDCGLGTVLSISPTIGTVGTELTLTGNRFDGNPCEYEVEIGSLYRCPVISVSSTQLICRIGNDTRLFYQSSGYSIRVNRLGQGYLKIPNELRFSFQTAMTQVSPTSGSIVGGTLVTIDGYGFQPELTLVFIAGHYYTNFTFLNYSLLSFVTSSRNNYLNIDLPVNVTVNGPDGSVCLNSSCTFAWKNHLTPQLISVEPSSMSDPTDLTIFGENFQGGNNISTNGSSAHISINGYSCRVTGMTNTEMNCSITPLESGYHLITGIIDGLGCIQSSFYLRSIATIDRISPLISSIYGGNRLTIVGNGFAKNRTNLQVTVGQNPCLIINNDPGEIQCIIPSQLLNSSSALVEVVTFSQTLPSVFFVNYIEDVTPVIRAVTSQIQNSLIQLNITGQNFVVGNTSVRIGRISCQIVSISTTSIICTMTKDLSAGFYSIIVYVDTFGNSNSNATYQQTLEIDQNSPAQGSFAGGLPVVITGNGFAGTNVSVFVCNRSCLSIEIKSNNELICVTPPRSPRIIDQICNMTVTIDGISSSTIFTYRNNLTSNITSISPNRGGTGGNTTVTIIGRHFLISNQTKVTIGGIFCRIRSMNTTTIICSTGSTSQTNLAAVVLVFIDGRGYADGVVYYRYMNVWSSRWTWDGNPPPESGTIVNIPPGVQLFFDMSTTPVLKALIIDNSTLIFDDSHDRQLNVEYILIINGGQLQIGSESQPFEHRAEINLYGDQLSIELPMYGAKVFAIREGTVDMHGKPSVRTWTRLDMTVIEGSSTIQLTNPIDWPLNSDIVISTTGDRSSQRECEQRRILNISSDGLTLTLNEPLTYQHLGLNQQLNTTSIEIRAEVGLLSRNIILQGINEFSQSSETIVNPNLQACPNEFTLEEAILSKCYFSRFTEDYGLDQFGATIMISPDLDRSSPNQRIIFRLSNIEIFNVGQAFRTNRHAINFYRNGNMSLSYIKSCSIHSSSNQAIHIEATSFLTIENNVIYNVMGRAILLQDGIEVGHVFRTNLIVRLQSSNNPTDEDFSPAAFWLSNPNQFLEGTAVAASSHYGYQYYAVGSPSGLSYSLYPTYRPDRELFGSFVNNSVHSCGTYGIRISPYYLPTATNITNGLDWARALFQGLVSWKNAKGMEYVHSRIIQIQDAIIFDNSDTGLACLLAHDYQQSDSPGQSIFYDREYGSFVRNTLIIGDSQTSSSPIIPSTGGLIVMWDRGLLVQNVTFMNFFSNTTPAISTAPQPDICSGTCIGWTTKFSDITFVDVSLRGRFRQSYDGVYEDTDGSLTGFNRSVVVAPDDLTHNMTSCTSTELFDNAVRCSLDYGSWLRFQYVDIFYRGDLNISNSYNRSTIISYRNDLYSNYNGYTIVLQANQRYRLSFPRLTNWFDVHYTLSIYDMSPTDYFIIEHVLTRQAHGAFNKLPTPLLDPSNASDLDWNYDSDTNVFSYIVRGSSNSSEPRTKQVSLWLYECPSCSFCNCPTTTTTTTTTATTTTETTATTTTETTATTTTATTTTTTTQTTTTVTTIIIEICSPYCIRYWSRDADWSSIEVDSNWNAQKPTDDQDIFVPSNITLIIDCPLPRIHTLKIAGRVEFQDGRNHTMYVDSIYLYGGTLIAGLPYQPFSGQIDIIMTNTRPVSINVPQGYPSALTRGITVLGNLELYGQLHYTIWTRLAQTARVGDTIITLRQPIYWNEGDEIIITTTDTDVSHTERHRIARNFNGTTIQLANPLAYTHLVIQQVFPNGRQINIAAAVGRLTRNIRIQSAPSSSLSGFNIYLTETLGWAWWGSYIIHRAFVRLSFVQLSGFGSFNDGINERNAGIYVYNLQTISQNNPMIIYGCAFVNGFNTAIEMRSVNALSITNNIIYTTYKSGIVFSGKNHLIEDNLITTIYWSGTAQSNDVRSVNMNFDAAIQSRKSITVILRNNLVAGVERVAYLIEGAACDPTITPLGVTNIYENNEAHSIQSGVNMWPDTRSFVYDRECVLIKGFTIYKASYHGFYIFSRRNITIDSCVSIDNQVGIFAYIVGRASSTDSSNENRIIIRDSIIVGAINNDNCTDEVNLSTSNALYSQHARVKLATNFNDREINGRAGIITPTISATKPLTTKGSWTQPRGYPCNHGVMTVKNTTFAYFNDVCNRHDVAFQASQINNDLQYSIRTELISKYNVTDLNIMYNGFPNRDAVVKRLCRGMDCDGLKSVLLINPDGTLFNTPTSVFSWDNAYWGDSLRGVTDLKLSAQLTSYLFRERINIATRYPFRGTGRSNSCALQTTMGMFKCVNASDYRLLVVENLDADANVNLFPITVLSDIGSINLISGPQDQPDTTSAPSIFTLIVQSGQNYTIFFKTGSPKNLRFRVINADSSFKCIVSVVYPSSQQIDVYANSIYVSPTNRDPLSTTLSLLDQPNGVMFNSSAGTNYFERRSNWQYFLIDGNSKIDLKMSPVIIFGFSLPPMNVSSFYSGDVAWKLAILLGVHPSKIRNVRIIASEDGSAKRRRRETVSYTLVCEIREEPSTSSSNDDGVRAAVISNVASSIISRVHSGDIYASWQQLDVIANVTPTQAQIQEPSRDTSESLQMISRIALVTPPDGCREYTPCAIQPVIVAYDPSNNVIDKLGSNERPWQIKATLVNQSNVVLSDGIANYVDGQTRFTQLSLTGLGSYQIRFSFIQPDGMNSKFLQSANFTVQTGSILVTAATIDGEERNHTDTVGLAEQFDLFVIPIDRTTRLPLAEVQWSNWTWRGNTTLYQLPNLNRAGAISNINNINITVDSTARSIRISGISINVTGMYIVNIRLFSSNDQHSIDILSKAILVTDDSESLTATDMIDLLSNITYNVTSTKRTTADDLEIRRAMIYNQLIGSGMPLASSITLADGNRTALFQVGTAAEAIVQAVSSILSNPNDIPHLTTASININGRSFFPSFVGSPSATSKPDSNDRSTNYTGLIVGLTVGLVLGLGILTAIILTVSWQRKAINRMKTYQVPSGNNTDAKKRWRNPAEIFTM